MHHITSRLHRSSTSNGNDPKDSRETVQARETEKKRLAEWEADKRPLEYEQILVEPSKKPVGHSSKLLRYNDFELIKTLGTGTVDNCARGAVDGLLIHGFQALSLEYGL